MRKLIAIVALGTMLVALAPMPAQAHGAALGLAAFAAFTALFALPLVAAAAVYPPYYGYYYPYSAYPYSAPVHVTPSAYYAPPVSAAPPAIQREVVYPHGRHVLYGDGIRTPYQWAWVPNPPRPAGSIPPPPAGPPPPAPPNR